eukprot:13963827-Alexandrium_andersonii.AAC.1
MPTFDEGFPRAPDGRKRHHRPIGASSPVSPIVARSLVASAPTTPPASASAYLSEAVLSHWSVRRGSVG